MPLTWLWAARTPSWVHTELASQQELPTEFLMWDPSTLQAWSQPLALSAFEEKKRYMIHCVAWDNFSSLPRLAHTALSFNKHMANLSWPPWLNTSKGNMKTRAGSSYCPHRPGPNYLVLLCGRDPREFQVLRHMRHTILNCTAQPGLMPCPGVEDLDHNHISTKAVTSYWHLSTKITSSRRN